MMLESAIAMLMVLPANSSQKPPFPTNWLHEKLPQHQNQGVAEQVSSRRILPV